MDSSIGLGEGQFKDLMKAIDSDDENTKPAKVTTTPWMTTASDKAKLTACKYLHVGNYITTVVQI